MQRSPPSQDELERLWLDGTPLRVSWIKLAPEADRENLDALRGSAYIDDVETIEHWRQKLLSALQSGDAMAVGKRADDCRYEVLSRNGCYDPYVVFHDDAVRGGNQELGAVMVTFLPAKEIRTKSRGQPNKSKQRGGRPSHKALGFMIFKDFKKQNDKWNGLFTVNVVEKLNKDLNELQIRENVSVEIVDAKTWKNYRDELEKTGK